MEYDVLAEVVEAMVAVVAPTVEWSDQRLTPYATTPALIASWIVGGAAFGAGWYLLFTSDRVMLAGIGLACVLAGLPFSLWATTLWRANRRGE